MSDSRNWSATIYFVFCSLLLLIFIFSSGYKYGSDSCNKTLQASPVETTQEGEMAEATQTAFPMNPPKVEVMSEWSDKGLSSILARRYVMIDGRLAVESVQVQGSSSFAFVPPDCGESEGKWNGNGKRKGGKVNDGTEDAIDTERRKNQF